MAPGLASWRDCIHAPLPLPRPRRRPGVHRRRVRPVRRRAVHSERHIQADAAGRNNAYILYLLVAQLHDGAFSKVFFYFRHRCLQGFQLAFLYLVSLFIGL